MWAREVVRARRDSRPLELLAGFLQRPEGMRRSILRTVLLGTLILDTGCRPEEANLVLDVLAPATLAIRSAPPEGSLLQPSTRGGLDTNHLDGSSASDPFQVSPVPVPPVQLVSTGPVSESPGFQPIHELPPPILLDRVEEVSRKVARGDGGDGPLGPAPAPPDEAAGDGELSGEVFSGTGM